MDERASQRISLEEAEGAVRDLQSAVVAVAGLRAGFVKRRLEAALGGIDREIRSQPAIDGGAAAAEQQGQARADASRAVFGGTRTSGGTYHLGPPMEAMLRKTGRAEVVPSCAVHAVGLAVHCSLLDEGFVCTGQDDGGDKGNAAAKGGQAMKGFAAAVRDVSEERLVPDRWDADETAVCFRYRRPDSPGKVFLVKVAALGGDSLAAIVMGEKGGESVSSDVDMEELGGVDPFFSGKNEAFFKLLDNVLRKEILGRVLPSKFPPSVAATVESPAPASGAGEQRPPPPPAAAGASPPVVHPWPSPGTAEDDPLRVGPPRFAGPPGVGPTPFMPGRGGDFGGDLFPSGGGIGGGGGGLPGPGGLLGPGHPMFGGGGGAGYMEPRFDPYGPPMPGQPWGPGLPGGRGGGAGRGGPSTGGPRGPPGGPDNDHLPPPGAPPSNMFF